MKKLIAGNWKMNGDMAAALTLIQDIEAKIASQPDLLDSCDFTVCPPFVHLTSVKAELSKVALGAQDCSDKANGAYTGDIAPAMIKDLGASYVILGHSERRQYHKESDALVASKAKLANENGLITIICVGELEAEREAGKEFDVVSEQLKGSIPEGATSENTVIAYEPVWAIGTGKTATPDDIRAMHAFIREKLSENVQNHEKVHILYGGSVKPANAAEIFAVDHVNGALIGGASLKAEDFIGIASA
jgi:triosephosphate isomerase